LAQALTIELHVKPIALYKSRHHSFSVSLRIVVIPGDDCSCYKQRPECHPYELSASTSVEIDGDDW